MDASRVGELLAAEIPDDPPQGFEPLPTGTGFNLFFGPIYGRLVGGKLRLGMGWISLFLLALYLINSYVLFRYGG